MEGCLKLPSEQAGCPLCPVPRQTATVAGSIGAGRSRLCWEKPGDCRPEEYWFEPGRLVAPDSAKSGSKGLVA